MRFLSEQSTQVGESTALDKLTPDPSLPAPMSLVSLTAILQS